MNAQETEIPTSIGHFTAVQIIDELTYQSFATNRDEGMSAESFGRLLRMDTTAYEARYQQELVEAAFGEAA